MLPEKPPNTVELTTRPRSTATGTITRQQVRTGLSALAPPAPTTPRSGDPTTAQTTTSTSSIATIAAVTSRPSGVGLACGGAGQRRALHVEAVLASVPVLDYTLDIARVHARLAVKAMSSLGKPRPTYDMIIAAEARTLLTTDASAGYTGLVGLNSELVRAD